MVLNVCRPAVIALIVVSLPLSVRAQSPEKLLPQPGPIAASAARIAAEQSSTVQRGGRSRVRRKSCAETVMIGTGVGAAIGLPLGVAMGSQIEDGRGLILAATSLFAMVGFVVGYRMCD